MLRMKLCSGSTPPLLESHLGLKIPTSLLFGGTASRAINKTSASHYLVKKTVKLITFYFVKDLHVMTFQMTF